MKKKKVSNPIKSKKIKVDFKNKNVIFSIAIAIFLIAVALFVILPLWKAALVAGTCIVLPIAYTFLKKVISKKGKHTNKSHGAASNEKSKGKKRKTIKKVFNIILVFALVCMGILTLVAGYFAYTIIRDAPTFNADLLYSSEASEIYDANNNLVAELGNEKRQNVQYDELPQVLIDAIVATEDSRFFQHNGFDLPRFAKASFGQLTGNSSAGGASTLTMQISKNNYTSTDKDLKRKFTDIYMAIFQIERNYTKEEILEFYVNDPYLGSSSYGVEQACQTYFKKSVSDINLAEAALIAGLFQSPGAYDPFVYPNAAETRRKLVLSLMKRHGYITDDEYNVAIAVTVEDMLVGERTEEIDYQGYIDTVVEEIVSKTGYNPYDVPMVIYTNLDTDKQDYIDKVLSGELYKYPNDVVQVGVAVVQVQTGKVVAIGAGRNREGQRSYNYATMIKRQPGSVAKPLFDYGPAIEFNNWSTYTPLLDEKYTYSDGTKISNSDGSYAGLLTARNALARSRNIPALKTFQSVDNKSIVSFVESLGITPEVNKYGFIHEAHAIGGFNGVSPLQIAAAYAAFGNGGYYIEPYTVNKIVYKDVMDGDTTVEFISKKERVMKESTAFMITDMLKSAVTSGTASAAKVSGVVTAAKTGTTNLDSETEKKWGLPSNAMLDLWLEGYSADYSIGLWYGYEELTSKYYHTSAGWGQRDAIFKLIANKVFKGNSSTFPTVPSNVKKVTVEKETTPAALPSAYTPSSMKVTEYFISGTEPTEVSPRYNKLNDLTNLSSSYNSENESVTLSWNYSLPEGLTNEYLQSYYDSFYGSSANSYLAKRKSADSSLFGTMVFKIYKKSAGGEYSLIHTTTNNSTTTYTDYLTSGGTPTYKVVVSYTKFTSNASDGAQVTVDLSGVEIVTMQLNGSSTVNLKIGDTYVKSVPEVLVYENLALVNADSITTKIVRESDGHTVLAVSTSVAETFNITYTVTYGAKVQQWQRTVIVSP